MVRLISGVVELLDIELPSSPDSCTGGNDWVKLARSGERSESARICCPENFLRTSFGASGLVGLVRSAFRLSISDISALWRGVPAASSVALSVITVCSGCNCSEFLRSAFFLCASLSTHCFFNFVRSASAFSNSSFNSRTRLSWAAMATSISLESAGELSETSTGVAGMD